MRKIAVMEDFLTPERRKKVLDTAEKCGFAVDFTGGARPRPRVWSSMRSFTAGAIPRT